MGYYSEGSPEGRLATLGRQRDYDLVIWSDRPRDCHLTIISATNEDGKAQEEVRHPNKD